MRKQAGIIAITTLWCTLLLQGCGSSGAAQGQGSTGSAALSGSSSSGSSAAPTLTFTGFSVVQVGKTLSGKVVAFFSEDMDASSINVDTFKVTDAAGKPVPGSVLYIGVTGVFTPNQRFDAQASYTATLTTGVRSAEGVPLAKADSWTFTTPNPSELTGVLTSITSTAPAAEQMDVPLNTGVNVSFHQLMDPGTINTGTFTLTDARGAQVPGSVHYSGLTASFVPAISLQPQTTYRAVVSAAAKSLSGVPMDQNHAWIFTTGTSSAAVAPQVVYTAPMTGDTGVSVNATVLAQFNEGMDATSISTASFTLHDSTGTVVEGSVAYTGDTAVFTPDAPLLPDTTYTATVNTLALSASGTAMQQGYDWTFTTGGFSVGIAPTVVFTNPATDGVSVSTSTSISVAFSEVVDPTSVTAADVQVIAQDGTAVTGSLSYLGNVVSFIPSATLASGMTYTVTLGSGIRNLEGVGLAAYSWSFTTDMAF